MDERALQHAEGRAAAEHERDDGPGRPVRVMQQPGGDGRGQRQHRADREVDAARQDHQAHADGQHQQVGVVDDQVEHHLRRGEAGVVGAAGGDQREQQHDGDLRAEGGLAEPALEEDEGSHRAPPRGASRRSIGRSSLDCRMQSRNTTMALTTMFTSGGTPSE